MTHLADFLWFFRCLKPQVTFYHVYFPDADFIAQWSQYSWTLDSPASAEQMLQMDASVEKKFSQNPPMIWAGKV